MEKNNCLNNVSNLKLSGSAVYSCFRKNTLFSKSQRCDTKSVDTTQNNASNILPETVSSAKLPSKARAQNSYSKIRLNSSLNKTSISNDHESFILKDKRPSPKDSKVVEKYGITSSKSFMSSKGDHNNDSSSSSKRIKQAKGQQSFLDKNVKNNVKSKLIDNIDNLVDSLNEDDVDETKDYSDNDLRSKIMYSKRGIMDLDTKKNRLNKFKKKSVSKSNSYTSNSDKSTASRSEAAKKIQKWYRSKIKYKPKQIEKIHSKRTFLKNSEMDGSTCNIFSSKDKSLLSSYRSEITEGIASYQDEYYDSFINQKFIESKEDKMNSKTQLLQKKAAKYSWLDEIENEVLEKTKEDQKDGDRKKKLDKNPYLSDEKYEHVLSYLEGLKQEGKTSQKKEKTTNKLAPKNHASHHINLKELGMIVNEETKKASGDNVNSNHDGDDEKEKRLLEENTILQDKISKHLSFIDQLIEDKKDLGENLEKFQKECKTMTQHYQNELKTREERHVIELKKLKDINLAAENLKREQWIKAEANKIKELTAKGFEPTLQKLIIQNQKEVAALKNLHKEEIERLKEKERLKYEKNIEEVKRNADKEIERVKIIERENAKKEFEVKLDKEKEHLRKEREDLWKEVEKERNEAEKMVKRQDEESKKGQENLKNVHEMAVGALKREFETARKQQKDRHSEEIEKLKKEHVEEQQDWEKRFFKSHENRLLEKEKELKEKIRKERDRDIEKILIKLENEKEDELEKQKLFTEDQIRKLEIKHKTELQQIEKSEKILSEKVSKLKAHIFKSETIKENLKAKLSQNKALIEGLSKKLGQHQKERDSLKDIVRQEVADKMAAFESENVKIKQEICDLKAKQKMEIKEIKEIAEKQMRVKEEEINEIQNRVKEVIARRNKLEEDLRKEKAAAIKRADYVQEQLLNMKNQPAKKKPTT